MQEVLTPEEVAGRLKMSPRTVRDWLRKGHLTGIKLGKEWRVRESDLEAFVEQRDADEEPLSDDDLTAVRQGIEAIRQGLFVTLEEYDRKRTARRR